MVQVLIIGGGLGGLCLAQGLRKAGITFSIFERDASKMARAQGYRLRIDEVGSQALETCLPAESWALFQKTCIKNMEGFASILPLTGESTPTHGGPPPMQGRNYFADRNTMRSIFMLGIEDTLHFGKAFESYETLSGGRVRVHFEDGSFVDGDFLVGADGRNSRVRRQCLPEAGPFDLGARTIYGKTELTPEIAAQYCKEAQNRLAVVIDPSGPSLFAQMICFDPDPAVVSEGKLDSVKDYVYWVLLGSTSQFNVEDNRLFSMSRDELKTLTLETTKAWHPSLRCILETQSVDQTAALLVSSANPQMSWQNKSHNVTVLGDAIHAMPPLGGQGANVALNDARILCEALTSAGGGPIDILAYETSMWAHARKAVEDGVRSGKRFGCVISFEEAKPIIAVERK